MNMEKELDIWRDAAVSCDTNVGNKKKKSSSVQEEMNWEPKHG
jgi:hypothetical protein